MKYIFTSLLVLVFFSLHAQESVSGTVRDGGNRNLIPGVTISVKGKSTTTLTDGAGKFTIAAGAADTLMISFIGYKTISRPVDGQNNLELTLQFEDTALDEVVVVGYGTQRKVDLTGAIASVKGKEIENMPNANPISSLQGKVAGLTISNSGSPGSAPTVRIRGVNSTNNANPLYVVDGVLHTNIDFISPQDIESMDILKDPSSIAIYGLKGANGVIAVTLKKAARGQTNINFSSSAGFNSVINRIEVTDAIGFKKLYDAQLANLNAAPFDYTNYTANTDWQDLILRRAFNTNNNLSISNNGEKSSTHFSLGYNKQEGVVKNEDYQRFTARLNQEIIISNRIKVGGDVSGSYWTMNPTSVTLTNALWAAPIVPVQENENTYYSMPSFQRAQVGNPIAALNRGDRNSLSRGYRFVGNIFTEITIIEGLKWKSTFYTDLGFNNKRGYTPLPFNFIELGENGGTTKTTFDNTIKTSVNQSSEEFRKFQQDHTLTYDKAFDDNHRLTAVSGFTTSYEDGTKLSGSRRDTTVNVPNDPNLWYLDIINQGSNPQGIYNGTGNKESIVGLFLRGSYAYQDKYLVNATIRRDGSSKIAPQNRWGTFGSVGLGWVVSQEEFFKNIEKINFLKLRFAWGVIGNSNGINDNIFTPALRNTSTAIFGDNVYTALEEAYIPDPNLKWEVVRGLDFGVELKAFNNKFSAEINLYDRTTNKILTQLPLPLTNQRFFTNLGKITNKGIELTFGWNDRTENFSYGINANYSYNKNIVNSIGDNINFKILGNNGANVTETGQSIGYFYGFKQVGIYQSTTQIENEASFDNSRPGDIAYQDSNGDGKITNDDRTYLGTPFPPHAFGLNLTFGYKSFDFQIEGNGVAGNKIYAIRRTNNFAVLNYETNRLNAWTGPGTSNTEPILDNSRGNNFLFSNYFLEPGDYLRIRTIQVGYNLANSLLTKNGIIKNARVFANAQNIKTWSKVTGYTPEAAIGSILAGGLDNGTNPLPATYTLGINLSF